MYENGICWLDDLPSVPCELCLCLALRARRPFFTLRRGTVLGFSFHRDIFVFVLLCTLETETLDSCFGGPSPRSMHCHEARIVLALFIGRSNLLAWQCFIIL
jgi:hypothetical protein